MPPSKVTPKAEETGLRILDAALALFRQEGFDRAGLGAFTVMVACCFLLTIGAEGMVCIAISLPLAGPLGALGGWLVYLPRPSRLASPRATMLLLRPAATLTWDAKAPPPVFEVRSETEVAAAPERVWKHVVSFSE